MKVMVKILAESLGCPRCGYVLEERWSGKYYYYYCRTCGERIKPPMVETEYDEWFTT